MTAYYGTDQETPPGWCDQHAETRKVCGCVAPCRHGLPPTWTCPDCEAVDSPEPDLDDEQPTSDQPAGGREPPPDPGGDDTGPRFTAVRMSDLAPRDTEWIIPGLLPACDVVVLVGEEGIGKGLWWLAQVRRVTDAGMPVLLIVAEDDPERTLLPRMAAAGINTELVHLIVADRETLTGHPYLPGHDAHVADMIAATGARLLVLDPWISVVPGHIQVRDSQQARQALDPLTVLARRTSVCILAVAHTNRGGGSTRDRVSLTAVLRQAARVLILALEDPTDPDDMLVGVDKANNTARGNATRYRKQGTGDAWRVEVAEHDTLRTIREWDATFRTQDDARTTDRWWAVRAAAAGGAVTRAQIVGVYGGGEDAADKAIGRWVKTGRLVRVHPGVFEVTE